MATQVLSDARIYVGEHDLSGDHSAVSLDYSAEMLDDTVFGDTTRSKKGGLKVVGLSGEGLWSGGADLVDDALFANIAVADVPVTVVPGGETLANACYLFRANSGSYEFGGAVGEMLRFSVSAEGSGGTGLARGELMHVGSETATGTKAAKVNLGALTAAQTMYAAVHVISVSGTSPTLDVVVRSDANASAGGETTRIAFTQATAITSEWKSYAGAQTDAYWDIGWTIGGTGSPTFEFIVSVGIL